MKIGVGITTCDRPDWLDQTIGSLRARDCKIVVVDNGSTTYQEVRDICIKYGASYMDGGGSNSPHGANLSYISLRDDCEAILKCDDDLVFTEDYLPRLVSLLKEDSRIVAAMGVCWSPYRTQHIRYVETIQEWITDQNEVVDSEQFAMYRHADQSKKYLVRHLHGAFLYRVSAANILYQKTLKSRGGAFGEYFSQVACREETEFSIMLRHIAEGRLVLDPSIEVFHGYAPGGTRRFNVDEVGRIDVENFTRKCRELGVDSSTRPCCIGVYA